MIRYLATILSAVMLTALCACDNGDDDARIGGDCRYENIPGTAVITGVKEAPANAYNCNNAVEIKFDFTPDDASAPSSYRHAGWSDRGRKYTVGAGMNPPAGWAASRGLTEGSTHRCIRSEITEGACTPVLFDFPDIDDDGWQDACF